MNILTKRGNLDNVVTYEHVCDEISDLPNIPSDQISLGSVAIVLKGENGGLEVYMADSNKEWSLLSGSVGGGGGGGGGGDTPVTGAQADWNIADENDPRSIKNRPGMFLETNYIYRYNFNDIENPTPLYTSFDRIITFTSGGYVSEHNPDYVYSTTLDEPFLAPVNNIFETGEQQLVLFQISDDSYHNYKFFTHSFSSYYSYPYDDDGFFYEGKDPRIGPIVFYFVTDSNGQQTVNLGLSSDFGTEPTLRVRVSVLKQVPNIYLPSRGNYDSIEVSDYLRIGQASLDESTLQGLISGSGGGSDDNVLIVHFTTNDGINWTCDKTYNEITSFMQSDPNHRVESPGYIIGSWDSTQVKADRTRAWGIQFIHIEMQGLTGPGTGNPYFNLTLIMLVLFEDDTIIMRTKTIS